MMIWGNEIVLNKVGSIAFADTSELRMCLFVKEHFHRLVKSRTHSETMTARGQVAARGRYAHEHFHRLVKRLRSMSDDISWMLLSDRSRLSGRSAVAVFTKKAARRHGPAWHCYSGQRAAYASGPTLTDRRDDEQRGSPYDAKCNVAEIGAVNMGEIGAVRKRSR